MSFKVRELLKRVPQNSATKRIAALDGWRGLAILLVLFDHFVDSLHYSYARPWMQTGQHGVTLFFVLSGFLITSKLMEGPIDLKRFYLRRLFRLMPTAWTYLATILLIDWVFHLNWTTFAGVQACLLFYRNFASDIGSGATGHFWSLSVEEQFYLVWPCILLFAGLRRSRWIAAAGTLACAAYRWLHWAQYDRNPINEQTQVRCDALLVGCLLAILLAEPRVRKLARDLSIYVAPIALIVLIVCIVRFHWLVPLYESIALAVLLGATVVHSRGAFARTLAFAPLAWIGTVSYSLYVWQALFVRFRSPVALFIVMPCVALANYYFIERPLTRLGHRLTTAPAPEDSSMASLQLQETIP
jgi:peptidoglycan/LPS O-acetylase OafA/YrhL